MTAAPTRQPKGIPVGGQFATASHAESEVTLAQPAVTLPTQREVLEARLHAARTQYEGFAQNEWADNVLAAYPDARYAHVSVAKDRAGSFAAAMALYRGDGSLVQMDLDDIKAFNTAYDPSWDMKLHTTAAEEGGLFVKDSDVFSLASIQDTWKDISNRPVLDSDPFAHLQGIERSRAELDHGDNLQTKAVQGYVQNLRSAILAEAPNATRIVVDRSADVESGLTFRLSYVEDTDGRYVDADLQTLQEYRFQDIYLDPHVQHDEATGDLYIDLQP